MELNPTATSSPDYDVANDKIVKIIIENSIENPRILDVGCWAGMLGKVLKTHIDCTIDGVEINEKMLLQAKENGYRNVFLVDLNLLDFASISDKLYDVIVFGDVLEHTIFPDKVLQRFLCKLNNNGKMIISLPNIGFIYYRLAHLFGFWNYKDSGVMDKTHLRFFTYSSMRRMIDSSGLRICRVEPNIEIKNRHILIRLLMGHLSRILPKLFAIQVVFLAERGAPNNLNREN